MKRSWGKQVVRLVKLLIYTHNDNADASISAACGLKNLKSFL